MYNILSLRDKAKRNIYLILYTRDHRDFWNSEREVRIIDAGSCHSLNFVLRICFCFDGKSDIF